MFRPKINFKNDPKKQWAQTDRIFFGFGACHILAGVFLEMNPDYEFYGEWIIPHEGFRGHHMYATNGVVAFDFHGYSWRKDLLDRYWKSHEDIYPNWNADIKKIDFHLLNTEELNARNHRGPDQYFDNSRKRAEKFITNKRIPTRYLEHMCMKQ